MDSSLAVSEPFAGGSINRTCPGYAVGLGAEWMFGPGWSTKLEYDYLGFGTNSYALGGVGATVARPSGPRGLSSLAGRWAGSGWF